MSGRPHANGFNASRPAESTQWASNTTTRNRPSGSAAQSSAPFSERVAECKDADIADGGFQKNPTAACRFKSCLARLNLVLHAPPNFLWACAPDHDFMSKIAIAKTQQTLEANAKMTLAHAQRWLETKDKIQAGAAGQWRQEFPTWSPIDSDFNWEEAFELGAEIRLAPVVRPLKPKEALGLKVRGRQWNENSFAMIVAVTRDWALVWPPGDNLSVPADRVSYQTLLEEFVQLDGTPCSVVE